ncbi:hypothetical protein Vafri_4379 [Volvox africanus]|uniref:Uncharacterized protein n=1 Tax=Volvox africanus TaxID=51714 RepID=A0A8J4EVS0_9CHLO|nr:hypothetical protein Vafri_4379 [Volvox africanus]
MFISRTFSAAFGMPVSCHQYGFPDSLVRKEREQAKHTARQSAAKAVRVEEADRYQRELKEGREAELTAQMQVGLNIGCNNGIHEAAAGDGQDISRRGYGISYLTQGCCRH